MTCAQYYLQCIYIYLHTQKIQCTQIILHDGWCSSRYGISTCKEHLSIPKGKQNSLRWIDDQCTLYGKCMQMLWCFSPTSCRNHSEVWPEVPLSQRGTPWCARFQSTRPCPCHRWHLNYNPRPPGVFETHTSDVNVCNVVLNLINWWFICW